MHVFFSQSKPITFIVFLVSYINLGRLLLFGKILAILLIKQKTLYQTTHSCLSHYKVSLNQIALNVLQLGIKSLQLFEHIIERTRISITILVRIFDHVNYVIVIMTSKSLTIWRILALCRCRIRVSLTMPSLNYIFCKKIFFK